MRYVDLGNTVSRQQKEKEIFEKNTKKKKKFKIAAIVTGIIVLAAGGLFLSRDASALFSPISIVSNIAQVNLDQTDGRINVLILGVDSRKTGPEQYNKLTDTMLFASIGRYDGNVAMISLPRDLWVKTPDGYFEKINAVYTYGGADSTAAVTENVLGVPVHYYAVVDFELFKDVIDILGGVEVDVDNTFDDYYYPVEGKENAPENERYETVHFDAGTQVMDGDRALKYVRSRKGTNNEGTDFARSKRQQKVIMAIKDKMLSLDTLMNPSKLKKLYDTYAQNVDTNMNFDDLQGLYLLSKKLDYKNIKSIVLDDRSLADEGGLLYSPTDTSLYGGRYVLIPRAGDYSQIHAYVQRYIFGE